ncbi:homospermidine synthase [Arboricoccus pini]|uniref:Homospermidine synthase n=1 Tax=Arboricoccus pini TaxID=1963835 RepID=A0A212PZ66_9PROT|nr:saccharopine dehydrogenase NADP-binding domain-containing protein [Arboricoccus pini]SNB52395.1 homospermidine synthase [Arboricoccus pini]
MSQATTRHETFAQLKGKLLLVGCGSIGQAVLPLILRHLDVSPDRITIVTADSRGRDVAAELGITFIEQAVTRENYRDLLGSHLSAGDFFLNLSVDVSSVDMMLLAREKGALYLDTVVEPWGGAYFDPSLTPSERSNYALRESMLALRRELGKGPTAVSAQGANPGMVSQLLKEALLIVARDTGTSHTQPTTREGWADLARALGLKAVHIAERDTQVSNTPKRVGEFVNTWSIDGFVSEGCQPAEMGWGTHEKGLPHDGARHPMGCDAAIYLNRPGASTRVRTWTPKAGPIIGFLITHNEAISIADYYTVREGEKVVYRPTSHYAYHPCDAAVLSVHELQGNGWQQQPEQRLMMEEIVSGIDELGVLLMGHAKGAFWYGSQLSIEEARELAPHNSATSLQVAAGVLGGMVWAIENPAEGIVEADELDHVRVLEVMRNYLGPVTGAYSDWTPLDRRGVLFSEDIDQDDPWQFKNIRVL